MFRPALLNPLKRLDGFVTQVQTLATAAVSPFPPRYVPSVVEIPPFPKDFKEHPDRDLVNFPHPENKLWPSKVRLGCLPDSWFQFFYNKTGVTGPYFFFGGLAVFLFQKEIIVCEEETRKGAANIVIFFIFAKYAGPYLARYWYGNANETIEKLHEFKDIQLSAVKDAIATELKHQELYTYVVDKMHEAKKENVLLQLEYAYRQRLHQVHSEVKRRLDYAVEVEAAKKRFQQRHMVEWIVSRVRQSITEKQEKAALQQCVLDLRALAAK